MGTAKITFVIVAALAAPSSALADPCTGVTGAGGRFATCFDLGNRASVTAGTDGIGGSILVRHVIEFDDEPDLVWKLEHTMLEATHGFEDRFSGLLYRGRFLRHARDGHILLPGLGQPKKIFLPFDIGALAEVGNLSWRTPTEARLGVVKTALLVDLSRTRGFRRRFAFGPVGRWDIDLDREPVAIANHAVAPFSTMLANVHLESSSGLNAFDVRVEAGTVWHTEGGWKPEATAEASFERIMIAVNDHPIALVFSAKHETATNDTTAGVSARVVLFDRRDPRVRLDPLGKPAEQAAIR